MAYSVLKEKQRDYADSNKSKIAGRRGKVGRRGDMMPNAKKGIKHTKRR